MYGYDLSADEIMCKNMELAIVPLASIEQHGPHLPVATDWYIAMALGKKVAELSGGFLVPALPISTCREHMGKKGSVWMDHDIYYNMLKSILLSIKEQGFGKALLLQCHGGIFMAGPLVRQMNATCNPDFMVAFIDICNVFSLLYEKGIAETSTELHAGEIETSLMLHIAPETVNMALAEDFVPEVPRAYLNYGSIFRASPSGVWGEPTKAAAKKGKAMLEFAARYAIEESNRIFDYISRKEKIGYSDF